jgi:hypothetical protein
MCFILRHCTHKKIHPTRSDLANVEAQSATFYSVTKTTLNPLTPELNPSAHRCLTRFFTGDFAYIFLLGILIFKELTARRLFKSFGLKGLK